MPTRGQPSARCAAAVGYRGVPVVGSVLVGHGRRGGVTTVVGTTAGGMSAGQPGGGRRMGEAATADRGGPSRPLLGEVIRGRRKRRRRADNQRDRAGLGCK